MPEREHPHCSNKRGGNNADLILTGRTIKKDHKKHNIQWVGRGNNKKPLDWFIADVESGKWCDFCYECNVGSDQPNGNWFGINDFLDAVKSKNYQ